MEEGTPSVWHCRYHRRLSRQGFAEHNEYLQRQASRWASAIRHAGSASKPGECRGCRKGTGRRKDVRCSKRTTGQALSTIACGFLIMPHGEVGRQMKYRTFSEALCQRLVNSERR